MSLDQLLITDGLSWDDAKLRYQKRRMQLLSKLKEVTLLYGNPVEFNGLYPWAMFMCSLKQDPNLLYYTGLNQVQIALLLNPFSSKESELLFLPDKNEEKVFWAGDYLGVGEDNQKVVDMIGISNLCSYSNLKEVLLKILIDLDQTSMIITKSLSVQAHYQYEYHFLSDFQSYCTTVDKNINITVTFTDLSKYDRVIMDDASLAMMELANQKSSSVFESILKDMHTFNGEADLAHSLHYRLYLESNMGLGFPSIIAYGDNACILHYISNDAPFLNRNRLLLCDFGLRMQSVSSDISRTIPVSGKYTYIQRLLYNIVLETMLYVESLVKPGITLNELDKFCWNYLLNLLNKRFFSIGGSWNAIYKSKKKPHFVGHVLGMIVHESSDLRGLPLSSGMVITNEPGLYGEFEWQEDGVYFKDKIGIRIEDDLLVTDNGCRNLTSAVKTVEDIEKLMLKE